MTRNTELTRTALYRLALQRFGPDAQALKLAEEAAELAALLMHITTQWLWEKLKAAYSLKELSDAVRAWKRQKNTGDTEQ
ncbi:TPA: hypothetical protein ACPTQ2_001499 [Escherichia coli]